jgi:hypothetical protein
VQKNLVILVKTKGMKEVLAVLFVLFSGLGLCQADEDNFSIYFASDKASGLTELTGFDARYYDSFFLQGTPDNILRTTAGDELVCDETGIYIEKNKILTISRAEVRENSQFTVNGDYLLGVIENDSVPVSLEGEMYYFLLPSKSYLFESKSVQNKLYQGLQKGEYLILWQNDNLYYSPLYIRFIGNQVELMELNYDCADFDLRRIEEHKYKAYQNTYIANPSFSEWSALMNCFVAYDAYVLKKD